MMPNWIYTKLGNVAILQNGYAFKSKVFNSTGIPILKIKNIVPPKIILENIVYFNEEISDSLIKYMVSYGDILISMTGSTVNQMSSAVGKIGRYKYDFPALLNQRVGKIILTDKKITNYNYLYYFISRPEIQYLLALNATGSANQANISPDQIMDIDILLPPLPEQHRIAEILGALDDKIELNLEMNKTLEEMAMAIYKEWFVDFGPFRDGEFVDSELGLIPKGWEVKDLNHISNNLDKNRKPISSRERLKISGNYPYYGATGILDWINGYKYDGRYVLMAEDGTVMTKDQKPYLQYIEGKFWVSNHAHVLTGKDYYSDTFLCHSLSNLYVVPYVTGAVQLKISRRNMDLMKFVTSSRGVHIQFDAIVNPLIEQIFTNKSEIETLMELRDFLLPKLISGEVRVKAAEEKVKEVL